MTKNKKLLIGLAILAICVCCAIFGFGFKSKNSIVASADTISEEEISCCEYNWDTISLVSKETRFTSNYFTVNYKISGTANVLDIDTEQNGIEVISETVIDGNSIIFELEYYYNAQEHFLIIDVLTSNGDILRAKLYAIDTACGIFIGPYSLNKAYENYVNYAEPAGLISLEESQSIRKKLYEDTVIENSYILPAKEKSQNFLGIATSENKDTYVKGKMQWRDDSGVLHPLRRVMVNIYDKDVNSETLLGTTEVDDFGDYSFTFQNKDSFWDFENGGLDIFMRVYAGDLNVMVKDESGNDYYYESGVTQNIATGTTKVWNLTIEMRQNTTKDAVKGQAFQVSQAIITAREYAWKATGNGHSYLTVYYPSDDTYYARNEMAVHVTGDLITNSQNTILQPYASWDAIIHEYGHHFQHEYALSKSHGRTHYINEDMCEHYLQDSRNRKLCDTCENSKSAYFLSEDQCKDYGIKLAWAEGMATAFSLMAQQYHCYRNVLQRIPTVGDACYDAYNLGSSYDMENNSYSGEGNESVVCGILWDLFDDENQSPSVAETFDKISLGHQALWNLVIASKATTLSNFIDYIYETNYLDKSDLGILLNNYKLTALNIDTNINMKNSTFIIWERGGTKNYKHNNFKVAFYNENKTEILKTPYLGNTNYYESKLFDWLTIFQNTKDYFYFSVLAYQDDGHFLTGPYISEFIQVDTPYIETLTVDKIISGEITPYNICNWYKFVAPTNGTYSFYTEGTTSTFGELFSVPDYESGTVTKLAFDLYSGEGSNFKLSYTLSHNTTVYLKVSANYYDGGPYTLNVKLDEHYHIYTYEYINRTYHRHACICGSAYTEEHVFELTNSAGYWEYACVCGYSLGSTVPGGGIQSVGGDTYNLNLLDVKNQIIAYPNKQFQ